MNDILAAISFYIIPILIGAGVLNFIKFFLKRHEGTDLFYLLVQGFMSFMTGALVMYFTALIIHSRSFAGASFVTTLKSTVLIEILLSIIVNCIYLFKKIRSRQPFMKLAWIDATVIAAIISISILSYALWKIGSPINTTLNWDIYHQQTLTHEISKGNFSYSTAQLSDSFQFEGYPTFFHLLLAIPQIIFNPSILGFWWVIEFLHLLTAGFAIYLFTYSISRSKYVAIIGVIMGAFFFESEGAYTALFLIPQNLTATVAVGIFSKFINDHIAKQKDSYDPTIFLFLAYVMLNHYIIGILAVFLAAVIMGYLLIVTKKWNVKTEWFAVAMAALTIIVFPIIVRNMDLSFLNRGEAAFFNLSWADKLKLIKNIYGYLLYAFLPLGIFWALKQKEFQYRLLCILVFGNIALFVAPMPYVIKLLSLGRYFIYTAMALGFWYLIKNYNKVIKAFVVIPLVSFLILIYTVNIQIFKQVPTYKSIYSHVTPNEVDIADYLFRNYTGQNVLLVSEPATMHILEGLSGINTPGGAYASSDTRRILTELYYSRDSQKMKDEVFQIHDKILTQQPEKILLAISGRFDKWQKADEDRKMGIQWNVWTPYDLSPSDLESYGFIDFAVNHAGFKEVYKNNGMVLLEISR